MTTCNYVLVAVIFFLQLTINVHTLIYFEHIKGFINLFFVVTFHPLVILFFKKEPSFWFSYFQQPFHLSLFFKTMSFIPITPNFFETSIGISNKLHQLEINSYFNFETCCFEMKFFYFHFKYFYLNMKVHISILKNIISI